MPGQGRFVAVSPRRGGRRQTAQRAQDPSSRRRWVHASPVTGIATFRRASGCGSGLGGLRVLSVAVVCLVVAACLPGADRKPNASSPNPSVGATQAIETLPDASSRVGLPTASAEVGGRLTIQRFDDAATFGGPGFDTLRFPVSAGAGYVVLGEVVVDHKAAAQAWISPDGRTWERVTVPAMDRAFVNGVAEMVDGTLVAIGMSFDDASGLIWTSDDRGRTWTRTAPLTDIQPPMQLQRIVAGPKGALLLGATGSMPAREGDSRLWWSPDGHTWTTAAMPTRVFGDVEIRGVTATASGFIGVGGRSPRGEPAPADPLRGERAAAWRSTDGTSWEAADVEDGPLLNGVVAGAQGMVGFGFGEGAADPLTWRSADGARWRQQTLAIPTVNSSLSAWDGRIFLLASRWSGSHPMLELWASADGVEWRLIGQAPDEETGGVGAAAPGDPGLVQVGSRDGDGQVWLIPWPAT